MKQLLPVGLSFKSYAKIGVFTSFLLFSFSVLAQIQIQVTDDLQKINSSKSIISTEGFDKSLKRTNPNNVTVSDRDLSNLNSTRTNTPNVINGDFEYGSHYWSRYYAHTVHSSSDCNGYKVMKLYGNWCGDGGVVRGFINNLTPGETYTLSWSEYVWDGYSSDYYVYVDGYQHINNNNNHTGWVTRSITFTARYHCEYLWFINNSHYNLYIDCIEVEEENNACDDLVFDLPDELICNGDSVTLTGPDGFDSYSWSTGETTQSITVSPNTATVYTINVSLGDCNLSNALEVRVNEPFAGIEGDAEICLGESSTLTVVGESGLTYVWSTGETTESITVSPTEDTEYSVSVFDGDCSSVERFTVNVTDISFDLPDQTVPSGDSTVIVAPDNMDSYLWSTGETTQSIVVSPDTNTVYTVTVTQFGCEFTNAVEVLIGGSGDFGYGSLNSMDAKVSVNGLLSIDANLSKNTQIDYQVYALNSLTAVSTRAINKRLVQGSNNLVINLKQHYNLSANTYYVLIINSPDLNEPKRIKFITK